MWRSTRLSWMTTSCPSICLSGAKMLIAWVAILAQPKKKKKRPHRSQVPPKPKACTIVTDTTKHNNMTSVMLGCMITMIIMTSVITTTNAITMIVSNITIVLMISNCNSMAIIVIMMTSIIANPRKMTIAISIKKQGTRHVQ